MSSLATPRVVVLACATVIEEMRPFLPPHYTAQVLDFGLHIRPDELRRVLQETINEVGDKADTILLGYGSCSRAVIGLSSAHATLVVPKTDDCIAIFLGSRAEYVKQARSEPGSYYLTKGWIEVGDTPFSEHERMVLRYGQARADRIINLMLKNYKRLAFINTGVYEIERYREHARMTAEKFGLRFEEIEGAPDLVQKLINGPWDDEFVVVPPGGTITDDMFRSSFICPTP
mgnify:CR=1 FL=1